MTQPSDASGVRAGWPDRHAVPARLWADLLAAADTQIDALGESATALLNDRLWRLLIDRINAGVTVRLYVTVDDLDRLRRCDLPASLTSPEPDLTVRRLDVDLPVSLLRSDDDLLATHYLPGVSAVTTPT